MSDSKSLFNRLAPTLRENGWRPLPGYQNTKRPSINDWNRLCDFQWTDEEFREVMLGRGKTEGKMVCLAVPRNIVAIDVDIEDEDTVLFVFEKMTEIFGATPLMRVGRRPRCLLVYRSDGSIRSRKHHPIEIFSGSGQFVAFGYHAGAGKDYEWPIKSPSDLTVDDPSIPIISQQQIDQFLDTIKGKVQFKTAPAKEYIETLFLGDTLVNDRETVLSKINKEADILAQLDQGSRNDQLFRVSYIAGQAMAAGLVQLGEIENTILNAASICGLMDEYDGNDRVRATMRSGFKSGAKNPFFVIAKWFEPIQEDKDEDAAAILFSAPDTINDIEYDDNSEFTLPPALIKGVLPKTGVAFIGGQSGAGKTFIAIDLAVALTTQQPFFGRKVKEKVGVLILAGEGAETLKLRVKVAREARCVDDPLPIAWMGGVPDLIKPDAPKIIYSRRCEVTKRFQEQFNIRLGVVIFDTLAATFLLENENDNSEASKVIKILQNMSSTMGVLCIPVHHYGKGPETGLRGASAWRAGSDAVLSVTAKRNDTTGHVTNHCLWVAKSRVGEEGPLGSFDLRVFGLGNDEDGEQITSCYIVPNLTKNSTNEEIIDAEERALRILASGEYVYGISARKNSAISLICQAFNLVVKNKRKLAEIILNDFIKAGKIELVEKCDEHRNLKQYCIVTESARQKLDLSLHPSTNKEVG